MARGVSSSTIPASAGDAQAGGRTRLSQGAPFAPRGGCPLGAGLSPGFLGCGTGSLLEGASSCIWFGLGWKMASFGIL
jgi:hypothetical protein